ncbi:hypothetical protein D3C76_1771190 [compost metagenome]
MGLTITDDRHVIGNGDNRFGIFCNKLIFSILLMSFYPAPELYFHLFVWTADFPFIALIQPIVG